MAFFRQLWALLWKGLIVRIRNPWATFFEVLFPIVAIIALSKAPLIMSHKCMEPPKVEDSLEVFWDEKSKLTRKDIKVESPFNNNLIPIYYYPSNSFTDDLMTGLAEITTANISKSETSSDLIEKVKIKIKYEERVNNADSPIGFIFESLPIDGSALFDYQLVTSLDFKNQMDILFERDAIQLGNSLTKRGSYMDSFFKYQILLNEALFTKLANDSNIQKNKTIEWSNRIVPKFKDTDIKFEALYSLVIAFFIVLLYSVMGPLIVKRLTDEKTGKVKELMRMMGMSDWVFWLSHFINYFIVTFIHCIVFTVILVVYDCPTFFLVNPILFFLVVMIFGIQTILFCMALSTLFDRAVMAILGTLVIHISTLIFPAFKLHPLSGQSAQKANLWRILSSMLPNMALVWDFDLFYRIMIRNNGFGFGDLFFESEYYGALPMYQILTAQILSMIFYMFIIWYLDCVWPSEYGIAKPFYFLCMPSYYCPPKVNRQTKASRISQNKNFESDPDLRASISLYNVRKVFSSGKGVHNITLNIFEGQITAFLGHNGAGKTTTMNMITGLYSPDSGVINVNGYDISTSTKLARSSLGLCPQDNILFNDLSVRQHLELFATLKDFPKKRMKEEVDRVITEIRLKDKAKSKSKTLSGGMKRRLSLGNAMVGGSQILILDEPSSGLDPEARRGIWDVLQLIRRQRTILLTTHYMEEADVLSDRIVILSEGKLKCSGSPMFLKKRFGAGYHLRITKLKDFNREFVNTILKTHLPDSRVQSEINTEIIYSLESEDRLKETNKDAFPTLFDDLDNKKSKLGIGSYGISVTTMEDVFLKVGSADEVEGERGKDKSVAIQTQYKKLKGSALFCSRIKGLLIKRWHFWRRYWPLFVFQIFFPVLIFIGIFSFERYMENAFEQQNDILNLVLEDLYPNSKGFFAANNTYWQNFGKDSYKSNAEKHKMENIHLINNEDPNKWLTEEARRVGVQEYLRKYVIGGAIKSIGDSIGLQLWWSMEATHSLPLSINLMYESLIETIIPKFRDKFSIITRNNPYHEDSAPLMAVYVSFFINCGLFLALLTPFIAASYVLFPIHERTSKSKFLQLMTGLSATTFWLLNYIWDITSHLIAIAFIFVVIFLMDTNNIFFYDLDSALLLVLLLIMFGIASIAMAYFFSFLFKQPPNGFTMIFLISLAFGLILHIMYMGIYFMYFVMFERFADDPPSVAWYWKVIGMLFRIVPTLSFNFGFSKLYLIGSTKSFCRRMSIKFNMTEKCLNGDIWDLLHCCDNRCKSRESCFNQFDAFSFDYYGVLSDIAFLIVASLIFFSFVICREVGCIKICKRKDIRKYTNKKPEDSDVTVERGRVDKLIQSKHTKDEAIVIVNLTKWFGDFLAVDHLSFGVHKNECFGLLGVNGAGKTTTFSMLTGEIDPNDGTAFIETLDLRNNTKLYQRRIGYCPQFDALLDRLTGEEMLYLFGRLRGIPANNLKSEVETILQTTDISAHKKFISKNYSGGTKRKLSLGIAIIGSPSLVFLDEPTAGVDPVARRKIWQTLNLLKNSQNSSIILTSHSMEESEALCARIGIMVRGEFKCLGSVQQLRSKFGQGFTLIVKMKSQHITNKGYNQKVHNYIIERLPSAQLTDSHECLLHYKLSDTSVKWSTMFRVMQNGAKELDLEDYSLSDTTLEQIFIAFAKQK